MTAALQTKFLVPKKQIVAIFQVKRQPICALSNLFFLRKNIKYQNLL